MSYSRYVSELRTARLARHAAAALREARGYSTDDLAAIAGRQGRRHSLLAEVAYRFADEAATEAEEKAAADEAAEKRLADFLARGEGIEAARIAAEAAAVAAGWAMAWRYGSRSSGSVYFWLSEPETEEGDRERHTLRISDHHAPDGAGWSEERQERHAAPDVNIVIRRAADGGYTFDLAPLVQFFDR